MKSNIESLSQRARSSPGVLRSSSMRHDALRGLTRHPARKPPSKAHLSAAPFGPLSTSTETEGRNFAIGRLENLPDGILTFEVASRFVAADSSSPGAREAREMGERKSTRVKTVAKALKRVDDDTRRQVRSSPPSVRLPDPMPPSRSAR